MDKKRYLYPYIREFLDQKILLLTGPRQAGKTTLALSFLKAPSPKHPAYFNWDYEPNRKQLLALQIPNDEKIIVLDEIHKYKKWRNFLKGLYDHHKGHKSWLVTGSARLDHYSKGGDSLLGRAFYARVHPFDLSELNDFSPTSVQSLLKLGGFPEPFLRGSERFHKVWSRERIQKVVREDLRDLERVNEISQIELLVSALQERTSQTITKKSLAEDLSVSPHTVDHWLKLLENLYLIFRLSPLGGSKIKSIKKEQKVFFWDWAMSNRNDAHRFENMVASHLLKWCHYHQDTMGDSLELRYLKDIQHRDVDFVVTKNKKPLFAVECKTGESQLSPRLAYFKDRLLIKKVYQVHLGTKDYGNEDTTGRVLPFARFAKEVLVY